MFGRRQRVRDGRSVGFFGLTDTAAEAEELQRHRQVKLDLRKGSPHAPGSEGTGSEGTGSEGGPGLSRGLTGYDSGAVPWARAAGVRPDMGSGHQEDGI